MIECELYIDANDLQSRDAFEVIEEFTDELSTMHGRCIDIGCGPGNVTRNLILPKLPNDASITGADISKSMIDHARIQYQGDGRMSFLELDIETADLPSMEVEGYDNCVSFYCLHWCQNMRQVVKNIYQLLRPGGQGLVVFLSYNSGFDAFLKLNKNPRYKPYMQDVDKYIPAYNSCPNPRASMKKILEEVGFRVLHCSNREKSFIYEKPEVLKKHIVAVDPFLHRIPDDLKEEYKAELAKEIMDNMILFENRNESNEQSVLDRYGLLIAHFQKPIA